MNKKDLISTVLRFQYDICFSKTVFSLIYTTVSPFFEKTITSLLRESALFHKTLKQILILFLFCVPRASGIAFRKCVFYKGTEALFFFFVCLFVCLSCFVLFLFFCFFLIFGNMISYVFIRKYNIC